MRMELLERIMKNVARGHAQVIAAIGLILILITSWMFAVGKSIEENGNGDVVSKSLRMGKKFVPLSDNEN